MTALLILMVALVVAAGVWHSLVFLGMAALCGIVLIACGCGRVLAEHSKAAGDHHTQLPPPCEEAQSGQFMAVGSYVYVTRADGSEWRQRITGLDPHYGFPVSSGPWEQIVDDGEG